MMFTAVRVVCMIIFVQQLIKIIFATNKIERPPYPKLLDWKITILPFNGDFAFTFTSPHLCYSRLLSGFVVLDRITTFYLNGNLRQTLVKCIQPQEND